MLTLMLTLPLAGVKQALPPYYTQEQRILKIIKIQ